MISVIKKINKYSNNIKLKSSEDKSKDINKYKEIERSKEKEKIYK